MTLIRTASLLGFFGLAASIPADRLEPLAAPVAVRLYDYTETPATDIVSAVRVATAILERAGIDVDWLHCSTSSPSGAPNPGCAGARGPHVLNLRLLPSGRTPPDLPPNVFGFRLNAAQGGLSHTANIYMQRIAAVCHGPQRRLPHILGAILAHELGHILLGVDSHSKGGLMALPWGPKALLAASRGMLGFSKAEGRRLRRAAGIRIAAAEAATAD